MSAIVARDMYARNGIKSDIYMKMCSSVVFMVGKTVCFTQFKLKFSTGFEIFCGIKYFCKIGRNKSKDGKSTKSSALMHYIHIRNKWISFARNPGYTDYRLSSWFDMTVLTNVQDMISLRHLLPLYTRLCIL